ncbi:MAG: hypothetical protein ACFBSE_08235 [Prochloraceae cyanobacterium]
MINPTSSSSSIKSFFNQNNSNKSTVMPSNYTKDDNNLELENLAITGQKLAQVFGVLGIDLKD